MWINVSIRTRAALAERLSDALLELGALSVSVEDADAGTERETPQFGEPGSPDTPLWDNSKVVALFEPRDDLVADIAAAVQALGIETPDTSTEEVAEQNWVQLTQSQFEPIRINERLWIVPSWHMDKFATPSETERREQISSPLSAGEGPGMRPTNGPPGSNCILQLDPGMAFGTGSHPTTRLCLEWLCLTAAPGKALLDYGCGSGILALAAAKLGADPVVGVEIDEQAITAAQHNAQQNHVRLDVRHSSAPLPETFDLVVANILTNPLCVLAPLLASRLAPGGRIALSGVLESQAQQVIAVYAPFVALHVGATLDGWCRLEGAARSEPSSPSPLGRGMGDGQ